MTEFLDWTATILSYALTAYIAYLVGQYRGFIAGRKAALAR